MKKCYTVQPNKDTMTLTCLKSANNFSTITIFQDSCQHLCQDFVSWNRLFVNSINFCILFFVWNRMYVTSNTFCIREQEPLLSDTTDIVQICSVNLPAYVCAFFCLPVFAFVFSNASKNYCVHLSVYVFLSLFLRRALMCMYVIFCLCLCICLLALPLSLLLSF